MLSHCLPRIENTVFTHIFLVKKPLPMCKAAHMQRARNISNYKTESQEPGASHHSEGPRFTPLPPSARGTSQWCSKYYWCLLPSQSPRPSQFSLSCQRKRERMAGRGGNRKSTATTKTNKNEGVKKKKITQRPQRYEARDQQTPEKSMSTDLLEVPDLRLLCQDESTKSHLGDRRPEA